MFVPQRRWYRPWTMRRLLAAIALAAAACTPAPAATPSPLPPASGVSFPAIGAPPALRLPETVAPVRYSATLTLSPTAKAFDGVIDIDLALREPTSVLWLGGTAISVSEARLEVGGRAVAVRATPQGEDLIAFALAEQAPRGAARLHVAYRGEISDKDDRGLFVEEEEGRRYLFSQFENIEARRAFPCFDEPSFKVPWQIALRVPEGDVALSNTPVVSETREPGGTKLVRFAETKPLPSYLVAFAVGPFDLVDAGKVGKTPIRIATPRGRASRAAHAAKVTRELFERVERYFGVPYPYDKLDIVAVPELVSFSAMENAGLITFFERGLLARPEEVTGSFERLFAVTAAHEIAHQWFGDLVTMAWWDDVWLNEAFASWMEGRIVEQYKPDWRWELARSSATTGAMIGDSLASARRVRQAIASKDDIQNAFDEITYSKGAAVIAMFESYVGEGRFRAAVARYLRDHAHRNATSKDFLAAVDRESGAKTGAMLSTFLDQPGVPLVRGSLDCGAGKHGPPKLRLQQRRYLPPGASGRWSTPVCVRWGLGKATGRDCAVVEGESQTMALASAGCPDWVMLNAGDRGYYHAGYDGPMLKALFERGWGKLSPAEKTSVIRDLNALVASSDLPLGAALARVPELAKDATESELEGALSVLALVHPSMLDRDLAPRFARFVQRALGARARKIGWTPKKDEAEGVTLIRPSLLRAVVDLGADEALAKEASALAERWLADPRSLPPDLVPGVLGAAAGRGDKRLLDRLRALVKQTKDGRRRKQAIRAMRSFRDPALVRDALETFLDESLDPRVALDVLFQDARSQAVSLDFLRRRYDAIVARVPGEIRGELPWMIAGLCDQARRDEASALFGDRVRALTGGPRNLAKALEKIATCAARRAPSEASLREFLKRY
jgi:cytosol alanyl aminopeptidase